MKKSSKLLLLMCLLMAQADSVMAASAEETSSISQKCAENVSKIQNVVEGSFTETPMYTTVHLNFRTEPSKESSVQTVRLFKAPLPSLARPPPFYSWQGSCSHIF